ncbi:MAG: beta-ketoacyl-[acyl-carrier-protein] synthase II [Silvanigrellales bacterium]|nr:beta-ketoacyl-[acyl-carrier-protein] synthase II [Silvanigrellales bacterium]
MIRLGSSKVVVTEVSVLSSLGCTPDELVSALRSQTRGLTAEHRFHAHTRGVLGVVPSHIYEGASARLGQADVAGLRAITHCLDSLASRSGVFERYAPERIGLYLGTSNSGVDSLLEDGKWRLADALEQALRTLFPLRGPSFTFCTACSSAAHAIAQGAFAVAAGEADAAIVGGIDLLNPMAVCGFEALQILDSQSCRPFHHSRAGINLGEGGALLLLERASAFSARGRVLGSVAGYGCSSDAHHITHPDPSGVGMRLSMERALRDAGIKPTDVNYINAHGTGTRANDAAEALAIAGLFGVSVPVSSTKGLHGHLLGSAGALEAVVSLLALRESMVWAGASLEDETYEPGVCIPRVPSKSLMRYVVSNSFGFGGNNVSLVFGSSGEVERAL